LSHNGPAGAAGARNGEEEFGGGLLGAVLLDLRHLLRPPRLVPRLPQLYPGDMRSSMKYDKKR
jgi:hypothetical protein